MFEDQRVEVMITSVAAQVVHPEGKSITPVTVPDTFPKVFVNEKSKVSAWPGEGNRPNKVMTAMRPNNFDFMITPSCTADMTSPLGNNVPR